MRYNAQPGDSLSLLSRLSGASVAEIRAANCLKNSTIFIGQQLYLPYFSASSSYNPPSSVSGPPSSSPQASTSPDRSDPAPITPPQR